MAKDIRVALVTTLRAMPAQMLESFVEWHLSTGFSTIYLYFDDPSDRGVDVAMKLLQSAVRRGRHADCIRVTRCDEQLRHEWTSLTTFAQHGGGREDRMVEARQMLNAEHALRRAHAARAADWLLHIDSDELFFFDGGADVRRHFAWLQAKGCVQFLYPIHEGCPEEIETSDGFTSTTLFRKHPSCLPDDAATGAERDGLRRAYGFWKARSSSESHYFLGSTQGKSAVAVAAGVRPMSVHTFYPAGAQSLHSMA